MKDEIKEILEYYKRTNKNHFGYEQDKIITYKEAHLLLDYITNLQEKYEEADNDRHKLFEQKEKAIEYINKHLYMESTCGIQHPTFDGKPNYDFDCFDLLNILEKGE